MVFTEPPTNTDSSVFIRILKLITDEKLKNAQAVRRNLINIKQRGRGPIILRKYMRKYGRIGASYTDDLRCRLEALYSGKRPHATTSCKMDQPTNNSTAHAIHTAHAYS